MFDTSPGCSGGLDCTADIPSARHANCQMSARGILLFVRCSTPRQHAKVSQGRICQDSFICCYAGLEVADQNYATRNGLTCNGVTVTTSAFLVCHQCYCAGSSLAWGLNRRALACGFSEARRQGLSPGTPVSVRLFWSQYTVTGRGRKLDLQLLSQCGST